MPTPCNICGGTKFKPGPGGRLSTTGLLPRCVKCAALERHRIFRGMFDQFRTSNFKELSCLMFSRDPTVADNWFASLRHSIYGTETSLDVQNIALAKDAYDVVICNHVLEHVPRYQDGFRELVRVARAFAFISFPDPHVREVTDDWGYPKPDQHMHYRMFGADIEKRFTVMLPGIKIARAVGTDPVTGAEDRAYLLSKGLKWIDRLVESGVRCQVLAR